MNVLKTEGFVKLHTKKQWDFQVQQAPRMLKISLVSITVPAILKLEDSSMRKLNNPSGGDLWILTISITTPPPTKELAFCPHLTVKPITEQDQEPKATNELSCITQT